MRNRAHVGVRRESAAGIGAGQRRCGMVGLGLQVNDKAGTARLPRPVVEHRMRSASDRPAPHPPAYTEGGSAMVPASSFSHVFVEVTGSAEIGQVNS
jgi:hypothetical protein